MTLLKLTALNTNNVHSVNQLINISRTKYGTHWNEIYSGLQIEFSAANLFVSLLSLSLSTCLWVRLLHLVIPIRCHIVWINKPAE